MKIFEEGTSNRFNLKLEEDFMGEVDLIIVDEHGNRVTAGYLLTIDNEGKLIRHSDVSTEAADQLGIKLNMRDCIMLDTENADEDTSVENVDDTPMHLGIYPDETEGYEYSLRLKRDGWRGITLEIVDSKTGEKVDKLGMEANLLSFDEEGAHKWFQISKEVAKAVHIPLDGAGSIIVH